MVEFLCPKLFTTFTILLNALIATLGIILEKYASFACYISAVFFTVNVIIFCVKSDVKLAFILNLIAFVFTVLFLGISYIKAIFYKYFVFTEQKYEEIPYPTCFLDDVNFQARMLFIGLLTLLFVTNFTNMWIYKVNYDKKKIAIPIPNQPILG